MVLQEEKLDLAIQVYRIRFSTNVERVALAAGHKGLTVEWVDVDPGDRSEVQRVSGQPLVPVLVAAEDVVVDSPRIVDWLEARFPEPPLYPAEPARRAEAEVFVEWFNRLWKIAPNRLADEGEDPALRADMARHVRIFERLLEGRDYLLGDFGIADVIAFPFLKYAAFGLPDGDHERFHEILVEYQPVGPTSPLHAWAARVDERPRG